MLELWDRTPLEGIILIKSCKIPRKSWRKAAYPIHRNSSHSGGPRVHQTEGMLLSLSVEAVVSLDFTRALRVDGLREKGLTTIF